jgi:hypothetical protein
VFETNSERRCDIVVTDAQYYCYSLVVTSSGTVCSSLTTAFWRSQGWAPFTDPMSGRPCYVDTRSGALHAAPPAMLALRAFAAEQFDAAVAAALAQDAALDRELAAARAAARAQQSHVLAQMRSAAAAIMLS